MATARTAAKATIPAANPQPAAPTPQAAPAIRRFDGSFVKIDTNGNEVLSDHLLPGERLRREQTDRYTAGRDNPTPDADKNTDTP